MDMLLIILAVTLSVIGSIGAMNGLDLKRFSSWLFGLCGLFCGFLIGLWKGDMAVGLFIGVLLMLFIMVGGYMNRSLKRYIKSFRIETKIERRPPPQKPKH